MSCRAAESCRAANKSQTPPPAGRRGEIFMWVQQPSCRETRLSGSQVGLGARHTSASQGTEARLSPCPARGPGRPPRSTERRGGVQAPWSQAASTPSTCGGRSLSSWRPGGHIPQQRGSADIGLCGLRPWPWQTGARCCFPEPRALNQHLSELSLQAVGQQVL